MVVGPNHDKKISRILLAYVDSTDLLDHLADLNKGLNIGVIGDVAKNFLGIGAEGILVV